MHRYILQVVLLSVISIALLAQQPTPTKTVEQKNAGSHVTKPTATPAATAKDKSTPEPSPTPEQHFDMAEVPPIVTHHQMIVGGKQLRYSATAGRLPLKDADGNIEAEMFFVAYTLDDAAADKRPLMFAFNGGPGSASVWLHMGALGPRKVMMKAEGFLPQPPFKIADNPYTPLDKTDIVLVDAIGTGYSRAASGDKAKGFWSVRGDIEGFSRFIQEYLTRYERWSSPLYLMGESYGNTRAAGVAGYLSEKGVAFNGIVLLSSVMNFQTIQFSKGNDLPFVLILPSYTMIAMYHKRLPPDLMQNGAKTREEAERWAIGEYAEALEKGDALTPQERQQVIDHMARFTGLSKELIDQANLRVDVNQFTHNLLIDKKVRVGRFDGRFTGPDPDGLIDNQFYDPSGSQPLSPFTSVFNNYVSGELGYKTDMPYYVFGRDVGGFKWEWGSAVEGYPNTAPDLRQAMVKNPYLKILVGEGYYDLATPYFATNYTMNHLDLAPEYRKNISYVTYESGHMAYLNQESLIKMKKDLSVFIDSTFNPAQ